MFIEVKSCEKHENFYAAEVMYTDLFSTKIYPDGKGGQLGDRGHINNIKIIEVKNDKIILQDEIIPGEYEYHIDMDRRTDIAEQHSAEHLFSGIALKDYNLNNVGFRMGEEVSTIDLDSDNISEEIVSELENKVNKAISKGANVLGTTIMRHEIPTIEGLRKKLSSKITDEYIRLIKIEGYDLCACAGFHVGNIKDIKIFKIISHEKLNGKTRFTFIAGNRVIKDYNSKFEIIKKLNHRFSSRDSELLEKFQKFENDFNDLKKSNAVLMQKYAEIIGENLLKNSLDINSHKVIIDDKNSDIFSELKKYFSDKKLTFIGMTDENTIIAGKDINCGKFIREILKENNNLKGGGGASQGNIRGNISKEIIIKVFDEFTK